MLKDRGVNKAQNNCSASQHLALLRPSSFHIPNRTALTFSMTTIVIYQTRKKNPSKLKMRVPGTYLHCYLVQSKAWFGSGSSVIQPPVQWVQGLFQEGKEWAGRDADHSPLLMPWSRKSRAIPLLPLWAVRPAQSPIVCTNVHFTFFTFRERLAACQTVTGREDWIPQPPSPSSAHR